MTEIRSTTTRRTASSYSVLTRRSRPIVASFCPGDVLEFREAGCRTRFTIPIVEVFRLSVRLTAEQQRRERRAKRRGES